MKKFFAIPLLLGVLISLCSATAAPTNTAAPAQPTATTASAALPAEYLVIKRSGENDTREYQCITNAADVRRIKALLPDYAGGDMVDKELTGTPIKVRYAVGETAYAYEIYPNDLIVWWYDMKCATVKGSYSAVTALLKNAPKPTDAPRIEAREYGAGDHFVHYKFLADTAVVQPLTEALTTMQPVDSLVGPLPAGGVIISAELIRGLTSESYYIYSYGYAQNQSTSQLYRLEPGAVDLFWNAVGMFASDPTQYALLTYWPEDTELERSRVYYTNDYYLNANPDLLGTEKHATLAQITTVLSQRKAGDSTANAFGTPILVTILQNGSIKERYNLYEDGALFDTLAKKWYELPESAYQTMLDYYKG